ncbi:MAG: hypothetical protein V1720_19565 [bacterium]
MKIVKILVLPLLVTIVYSCSTLKLAPADFGWPVETVLKVDQKGFIADERYAVSFNTKAMFFEEFIDSVNVEGKVIRLIRDVEGFYFLTGNEFKNVYVFYPEEGKLILQNKILITESGLQSPYFNQRKPYVELTDGTVKYSLNKEGIVGK